jgi:hypothetical protein
VTDQGRLFVRSAAILTVALLLSAPAAQAAEVAAAGPCAVAPDREPCAGGACAKSSARTRNRFSPEEVASNAAPGPRTAPLPNPNSFTGPGTCADPSAGCGPPRTERVVASVTTPRPPSSGSFGGPPSAPTTPSAPAPPVPPAPPSSTPPSPPPTVVEPPPGPVLPPGVPVP